MALIVELPAKSELPEGGTPADDRAYLEWRDGYLSLASEQLWARHWHNASHYRLPAGWQLDAHLYVALRGSLPLFGRESDPITYQHRLRFLGIALRTRRRDVLTHAARYVESFTDAAGRA
jgi:hypothetical protein